NKREYSLHLIGPQSLRSSFRRRRRGDRRLARANRLHGLPGLHKLKEADDLLFAAVVKLEIILCETGDYLSVLVNHNCVELYKLCADPNSPVFGRLLRFDLGANPGRE